MGWPVLQGWLPLKTPAREGELDRHFEIDVRRIGTFWNASALWLLAIAELHIGPEAAVAQGDHLAGIRERAEFDRFAATFAVLLSNLTREFAVRIVRATDESAKASELQVEASVAAGRALARIDAFFCDREDVRRKDRVELVDDVGDLEVLGLADGGREVAPEIAQQLFPVQLACGHLVELLFEIGGEAVFDIAFEEAAQKGCDQAALVFWNEAIAIQPHVSTVAQRGKN